MFKGLLRTGVKIGRALRVTIYVKICAKNKLANGGTISCARFLPILTYMVTELHENDMS